MKKYKIGDVLIRRDGEGIRVVSREKGRIVRLARICVDGSVNEFPHLKNTVDGNFYKKLDV